MSLIMKYFVLKPAGDDKYAAASRRAMVAYADWIKLHADNDEERAFAKQLTDWAGDEFAKASEGKFPDMHDERGQF